MDEMVGRVDMLDVQPAVDHWKAAGLDLSPFSTTRRCRAAWRAAACRRRITVGAGARSSADRRIAGPGNACAGRDQTADAQRSPLRGNAMLSGEIARRYGSAGLPDDTIRIHLDGLGRAELGRVSGQGRDADARRRGQRLRGQGPLRRRLIVYPPRRPVSLPKKTS
jgi:glutamate synthase (NADPH/NADH) large chain